MRKFIASIVMLAAVLSAGAQALPSRFEVKIKSKDHVQGMAVDTAARCFYLSFTTSLVKVDYEGNVLAKVDSINGHLGAMFWEYRYDTEDHALLKPLVKTLYGKETVL